MTVALLLGVLPSVFAQTGGSAAEAFPVTADGQFAATTRPQGSTWFRFGYQGGGVPVTIATTYQPADAERTDLVLHTGSAQSLRSEGTAATRSGNTLTQTFADPGPRDVFIQFVNDDPLRTVSFVGQVSPTSSIAAPGPSGATPTAGPVADSPQNALTVGEQGVLTGTIAQQRAVWYRFWYGNPGADASLGVSFAPNADAAGLDVYTGSDLANLSRQSGNADRSGETLSRTVNLAGAQFVYFTVANNHDAMVLAYSGRVSPAFAPPTPVPSATAAATAPAATPAPTAPPTAPTATPAPAPPPQAAPPVPHDERYFAATGFRIESDAIWSYFNARGRTDAFGLPVSRTFTFLGCPVQIFQRQVAQACSGQGIALINLLDPDIFPYTQVNFSVFPAADEQMKANTPSVSDPAYAEKIVAFIRASAPNQFMGEPVNFGDTFFGTITPAMAGTDDPNILALINLEVWGAPISQPMRDPTNGSFIYQRFQRGIMHYVRGEGTRGILLADYLKQILLGPERAGPNLPPDLREQAQGSRFISQYCPGAARWLCRPNDLSSSDLTFAFEAG